MGAPELLLVAAVLLVGVGGLVVVVLAVVDAARRPDWVWARAGRNKTLWIALPIVLFVVFSIIGAVVALVYLLGVRPELSRLESAGPSTVG